MSVMSDRWIAMQCLSEDLYIDYIEKLGLPVHGVDYAGERKHSIGNMIEPFFPEQVRTRLTRNSDDRLVEEKCLSYGLSSYGYDIRLAPEFKVFTNIHSSIIDPHNFNPANFVHVNADEVLVPPNSFILGRTEEYFRIPKDILVNVIGKSTLARCGANVIVTPLEPGWEGTLVVEIANCTNIPLKIRANEGVAQMLFLQGNEPCLVNYADRAGKYNRQEGIQVAKLQ